MNSTSYEIQRTLEHAVDEQATVHCVNDEIPLSPFLAGSFDLYRGDVLGSSVLFAKSIVDTDEALLRLDALEKAVGEPVAIFLSTASAHQKRSLMAARRGFVTGQGDMYLPQLAIMLKGITSNRSSSIRRFTPAQQQAFLYCLLGIDPLTQEGLRETTGISAASASRALSSLSDAGLIDYEIGGKTGRKREYFVPDRAELFRKGRKLFGEPIRSIERVVGLKSDRFPISGLSALARRSDLVSPSSTIIAAGQNVDADDIFDTSAPGRTYIVQRLSYDPIPFAENGMVDPFTMLVTIDERDERISIALREALKGCPWYTD